VVDHIEEGDMDRQAIEERIAALEKQRESLVEAANRQIAALNGAIAERRWELEQLGKAEPPEPVEE
jgi:uncharacterized protein involved in exopolysaccharide biosynthesis